MSQRIRLAVVSLALVLPAMASPQAMSGPSPVLVVGREVVKPGKGGPHEKWETAWSRALEAAKYPQTFLALTAMSGPREVWFVYPYASMAELQKANEAYAANPAFAAIDDRFNPPETDYLQDARGMTLTARPDLSYSTGRPISEARFLSVTRILVRPGHTAEFIEARTAVKAAHEKAKLPDSFSIYQATLGMPGGTFYLFAARKSLAEIDDGAKVHADPAYVAALGPDWTKRNAALVAAYETSTDQNLFAVSPGMSSVPKEWKDADAFWKPKAPAKKAP